MCRAICISSEFVISFQFLQTHSCLLLFIVYLHCRRCSENYQLDAPRQSLNYLNSNCPLNYSSPKIFIQPSGGGQTTTEPPTHVTRIENIVVTDEQGYFVRDPVGYTMTTQIVVNITQALNVKLCHYIAGMIMW